jgi:hypothetical protein
VAAITDFDSLRDAIVDYAHTPHLVSRTADFFIPLGLIRIGRDLTSLANEALEEYTAETPPLVLPLAFGAIRNVTFIGSRGPRVLQSRSANTIWPLQRSPGGTGDTPAYYNIRAGSVVVAPAIGGDYEVSYYAIPEVTASQATDPALTAWPMLFLYAGLIEVHVWTRNRDARQEALDFYTSEIKQINKMEGRARHDNPAGVASPI